MQLSQVTECKQVFVLTEKRGFTYWVMATVFIHSKESLPSAKEEEYDIQSYPLHITRNSTHSEQNPIPIFIASQSQNLDL